MPPLIFKSLKVPVWYRAKNLKKYFYLTDIPTNSLTNAFQNLAINCNIKKPVMLTVLKKQLCLVLPVMGKTSALVKFELIRSLHTQPAHNVLSTSPYGPILVETPQTRIGPN